MLFAIIALFQFEHFTEPLTLTAIYGFLNSDIRDNLLNFDLLVLCFKLFAIRTLPGTASILICMRGQMKLKQLVTTYVTLMSSVLTKSTLTQ